MSTSTNYHAASIIGCRINRDKLFFDKKVRSCDCAVPETKYCQQCGSKWWCTVAKAHPQYNYDTRKFCDLEVFDNYYSEYVFIAVASNCVDEETYVSDINMDTRPALFDALREEIKGILEPLGMWENFGIWTVMWCS